MRNRKARLTSIMIGVALLGAIVLLAADKSSDRSGEGVAASDIVVRIGGEPVERREWRLIYAKHRSKESALAELVTFKTIQAEAVRRGLLDDADYEAFMDELARENSSRQEAVDNGQWIAGPKRFSAHNFYENRQAELTNRLKEVLSDSVFDLGERALEDYFDNNLDTLGKRHDTIKLQYIAIPIKSDSLVDYGDGRRDALAQVNALYRKLQQGAEFQSIYSEMSGPRGVSGTEIIDEGNYRDVSKYRSDYYHGAMSLAPGEISSIVEDQNQFIIVYCSSREDGGYRSFQEVRGEVEQRYVDDRFDAYIATLSRMAKVELLPLYGDIQ